MSWYDLVMGVVLLGLLAGGVLFLIFRDARRMDKRSWWQGNRRRKAKPMRGGAAHPQPNDAFRGAGTS